MLPVATAVQPHRPANGYSETAGTVLRFMRLHNRERGEQIEARMGYIPEPMCRYILNTYIKYKGFFLCFY